MKTQPFDIDLQKVEIAQTLFNRYSLKELQAILAEHEQRISSALEVVPEQQEFDDQNINP